MDLDADVRPAGRLALQVIPGPVTKWREAMAPQLEHEAYLHDEILAVCREHGIGVFVSELRLKVLRADGRVEDLGLAGRRVVTTAGVNKIVALLNTSDASTATTFKYHGLGKQASPTAPAIGDTALQSELTTEYNPDSTRATGTQVNTGTNVYQSVGTNTVDGAAAVTEYGIFSAASAGTLLDRFTFLAVNLAATDGLQGTFSLTFTAGG